MVDGQSDLKADTELLAVGPYESIDPELKKQQEAKEAARKERAERIAAVTNRLTQPRRPIAPSIIKKHNDANQQMNMPQESMNPALQQYEMLSQSE